MAGLRDANALDTADGIRDSRAAIRGKCAEIMRADEYAQRGAQCLGIEWLWHVPRAAKKMRRQHVTRPKIVAVDFSNGVETRMETRGCFCRAENSHAWRQDAIHGALPFGERHAGFRRGIEMRHLRERVNSGVRATRAVQPYRRLCDARESGLYRVLDRVSASLALPAREGRAVVGDGEPDAHAGYNVESPPACASSQLCRITCAAA